ncbi:MAG: hypothetical protein HY291_07285 [Planctomycetes bacterium]|nr:hypothetical protein [Planctomycetota bacterium]
MPLRGTICRCLLFLGCAGLTGLFSSCSAAEKSVDPAKTEEKKTEERKSEPQGGPKQEEKTAAPAGVEAKLEGDEAEQALKGIGESFAKAPCIQARVKKVVKDELLGDTEIGGLLSLQRPDKMLIRMDGAANAHQVRQLDGNVYREFVMANRHVMEKNFANAPKKLALLRAAMTVDLAVLKEYFDIAIYRTPQGGEKPANLRLVLTSKAGAKLELPWQKIEVKLSEGGAFLLSIAYEPKQGHGEPVKEEYTDIKTVEKFTAKDLSDDLLIKGTKDSDNVKD